MSEKFAGAIGAATQDKIFKDGTIRLKIDIEPAYAEMVTLGLRCRPDVPVIVAFLSDDEAREAAQERTIAQAEPDPAADYGQQARGLKLSAFFKRKDVQTALHLTKGPQPSEFGTDTHLRGNCPLSFPSLQT